MSWLSKGIDFLAGNPDAGKMKKTLSRNMGQYIDGMQGIGNQLQDMGTASMDFNSGINQNYRNMFNTAAQDATATGALQAGRMAAQQGMGGSGLLQQATHNQAYSNMMNAGLQGLKSYMNQQKLGQGYLTSAGRMLNQAGAMQSNLNTSFANVDADTAANRGAFGRGLIGIGLNRLGQED